ncbi:hypothetical protein OIO90_003417 [Microbotryomycetes sp. JL221]|nr:hypothetical protein OIO90_003417 [Microbotryomycetes sp. JL221]
MVNAKQAAGRARKAEAAEKKADGERAKQAAKEDAEWSKGAKQKDKSADKQAAAEEARKKKAERDRMLAEEEASLPSKAKASAPKAGAKKTVSKGSAIPNFDDEPMSFSASGIDDALDMLSLVSSKTDKAAVGSQAAKIDTHPERRFKAAFEAYKERELPRMKMDYPGLRLQQYNDRLHEAFKKSPQNPFNQQHLSYDASKADKVAALQAKKDDVEKRLRDS